MRQWPGQGGVGWDKEESFREMGPETQRGDLDSAQKLSSAEN